MSRVPLTADSDCCYCVGGRHYDDGEYNDDVETHLRTFEAGDLCRACVRAELPEDDVPQCSTPTAGDLSEAGVEHTRHCPHTGTYCVEHCTEQPGGCMHGAPTLEPAAAVVVLGPWPMAHPYIPSGGRSWWVSPGVRVLSDDRVQVYDRGEWRQLVNVGGLAAAIKAELADAEARTERAERAERDARYDMRVAIERAEKAEAEIERLTRERDEARDDARMWQLRARRLGHGSRSRD